MANNPNHCNTSSNNNMIFANQNDYDDDDSSSASTATTTTEDDDDNDDGGDDTTGDPVEAIAVPCNDGNESFSSNSNTSSDNESSDDDDDDDNGNINFVNAKGNVKYNNSIVTTHTSYSNSYSNNATGGDNHHSNSNNHTSTPTIATTRTATETPVKKKGLLKLTIRKRTIANANTSSTTSANNTQEQTTHNTPTQPKSLPSNKTQSTSIDNNCNNKIIIKRSTSPKLKQRYKLPLQASLCSIGITATKSSNTTCSDDDDSDDSTTDNDDHTSDDNIPIAKTIKNTDHDEYEYKSKTNTKASTSSYTSNNNPRGPSLIQPTISSSKRILLYTGPEPSLPPGWTLKHYKRMTGNQHTDRYWFSPILKKKFRSLTAANLFLDCLKVTKNGSDEVEAWESFKKIQSGGTRKSNSSSGSGSDTDDDDDGGGHDSKKKKKNNKTSNNDQTNTSATSPPKQTTTSSSTSKKQRSSGVTNNGSRSHNNSNQTTNSQSRGTTKIPPIPSPGLYTIPTGSIKERIEKQFKRSYCSENCGNSSNNTTSSSSFKNNDSQTEKAVINNNNDEIIILPKIETNSKGHVTTSTLFNHSLYNAGLFMPQRAKEEDAQTQQNYYFGSSICRTVDDMFDTSYILDLKESDLIPQELLDKDYGEVDDDNYNNNGMSHTCDNDNNDNQRPKKKRKILFTEAVTNQLQRAQKLSSHDKHSMTFEDMVPKSLVTSLPPSFVAQQKEYYKKIKERENALKLYHDQKEKNEALMEKYEDSMQEWSFKKEENELQLIKSENNNEIKISQSPILDMKSENEKPPEKPTLLPLIEVPPIPIRPKLTSEMIEVTENHYDEKKKVLVAHLDPACLQFNGRYFGLISNNIADPQFVGPNAPGIGMNISSFNGLATAYASSLTSIERVSMNIIESNSSVKKGNSSQSNKHTPTSTSESNKSITTIPSTENKSKKSGTSSMRLKKIMERGDEEAEIMRDAILRAAVLACRQGTAANNGGLFTHEGVTYTDVNKAFSNYGNMKPCSRCKNNKQGAYHCRIRRKHKELDHDGGDSYEALKLLFLLPIEDLDVKGSKKDSTEQPHQTR